MLFYYFALCLWCAYLPAVAPLQMTYKMRFENESFGDIVVDLNNPGYLESQRLCMLIDGRDPQSCVNLMLQTHRSLKAFVVRSSLDAFHVEKTVLQSAKVLAASYGIESCPPFSPVDICMFGTVSIDLVMLTLLSCRHHRLQMFFSSMSVNMQAMMYSIRASFPTSSVQWMLGPFDSWFAPPQVPSCDVIYIERDYLALILAEPADTPLRKYIPLLQQQTRPVTIIVSSALGVDTEYNPRADLLLAPRLAVEGTFVDWRLHTVTNIHSPIDNEKFDYYGFIYRMFAKYSKYDPADIDRLSIGYLHSPLAVDERESAPDRDLSMIALCDTAIAITYTNRIFLETARGLLQSLERIGMRGVQIWGDMHLAMDSRYTPSGGCALPLQIAIAPHEETMLLPRYIVYHMEQTWSIFSTEKRYEVVLREAEAVWIFSSEHRALVTDLGVEPQLVHLVPMPVDASYLESTVEFLNQGGSEQSVGIAFFGSSSERRMTFANDLMRNASLAPFAEKHITFKGSVGGAENGYFGLRRDALIRSAKVVLNVHGQESSALEVHRLNFLLSMGKCVITERSSDIELDEQYEGVVMFRDVEDMLATSVHLLEDDELRREMELRALSFTINLIENTTLINAAMVALM